MVKNLVFLYYLAIGFAFAQTYDLPILFIDTKQKCLDYNVNEKIPATIKFLDGKSNNVADSSKGFQYDIGIKVRGQNSAAFPKPNYTIEFHDSTGNDINVSLLGLPPSDDWVLQGLYIDKSMVRNSFAHWLFRQTGRYSPRTKYFDLYINGVYRGVYVLIERIKRGKYRVDVSKLKKTDIEGDELTGGYIWKFDWLRDRLHGAGNPSVPADFKTSDGVSVVLRYPSKKKIAKEQEEYLKNYLNELEALYKDGKNGSGYENYVDVISTMDYILHQELTQKTDAYWYDFFMYKPKDKTDEQGHKTVGKIAFGPPWDFDLTFRNSDRPESSYNDKKESDSTAGFGFGNQNVNSWLIEYVYKTQGFSTYKLATWVLEMWKDSIYQSEIKKRWAELRSGVWHTKSIDAYLDSMKTFLTSAAERNFKRWPNLGKASGTYDADPEPMRYCKTTNNQGMSMAMGGYNADSWDGEFEHVRKKVKERIAWMDKQLDFTEPENPVVFEAIIHEPDWRAEMGDTGKVHIQSDNFSRLSPTNYFIVNGNRIEVHTDIGGTFAFVDLNGAVLYKTQIKTGATTLTIPANARNKAWIATLNGKMISR